MRWIRDHPVRLLLATGAFLAVILHSPPITSSIPDTRTTPPTLEEVVLLTELHEWIDGVVGPEAEPLDPARIGDLMRQRSRSFELFASYHPQPERQRLLRQLPYGELIARTAGRHRLDGLLLASLVEAESSFNPWAISVDGALGLTQILPATAGSPAEELLKPRANLDAGARYLAALMRRFGGDIELALAAYNAGPGAVHRFDGVPPYQETERYVARVLDRYLDFQRTLWRDHMRRDWYLE